MVHDFRALPPPSEKLVREIKCVLPSHAVVPHTEGSNFSREMRRKNIFDTDLTREKKKEE